MRLRPGHRNQLPVLISSMSAHEKTSFWWGGIAGWTTLMVITGGIVLFEARFNENFRPEIGAIAILVLWDAFLSFFYLINFALIALLLKLAFRLNKAATNWILWFAIGGLLFLVSVPLWNILTSETAFYNIEVYGTLAFISGGVACSTTMRVWDKRQKQRSS